MAADVVDVVLVLDPGQFLVRALEVRRVQSRRALVDPLGMPRRCGAARQRRRRSALREVHPGPDAWVRHRWVYPSGRLLVRTGGDDIVCECVSIEVYIYGIVRGPVANQAGAHPPVEESRSISPHVLFFSVRRRIYSMVTAKEKLGGKKTRRDRGGRTIKYPGKKRRTTHERKRKRTKIFHSRTRRSRP